MTPPCRVVRPKVSPPPRPMTTRIELHRDRRDGAVHQDDSLVFAQPPTRSRPSPVCTLAKPASPLSVCPPPTLYFHPTLVPEVDLRLSAPKVACWNPHRQVCLPLRIHT